MEKLGGIGARTLSEIAGLEDRGLKALEGCLACQGRAIDAPSNYDEIEVRLLRIFSKGWRPYI